MEQHSSNSGDHQADKEIRRRKHFSIEEKEIVQKLAMQMDPDGDVLSSKISTLEMINRKKKMWDAILTSFICQTNQEDCSVTQLKRVLVEMRRSCNNKTSSNYKGIKREHDFAAASDQSAGEEEGSMSDSTYGGPLGMVVAETTIEDDDIGENDFSGHGQHGANFDEFSSRAWPGSHHLRDFNINKKKKEIEGERVAFLRVQRLYYEQKSALEAEEHAWKKEEHEFKKIKVKQEEEQHSWKKLKMQLEIEALLKSRDQSLPVPALPASLNMDDDQQRRFFHGQTNPNCKS